LPESFDIMKAAIARMARESESRTGKPDATPKSTPRGAPLDSDKILPAAWSETFPDHPPEVVEEPRRQRRTEPPGGPRAAAPPPTTSSAARDRRKAEPGRTCQREPALLA
jgi:hypothetical protein